MRKDVYNGAKSVYADNNSLIFIPLSENKKEEGKGLKYPRLIIFRYKPIDILPF